VVQQGKQSEQETVAHSGWPTFAQYNQHHNFLKKNCGVIVM